MRERTPMIPFLEGLAAQYSALKSATGAFTGASEDLLHVHAGLLIFVASAMLLRQSMRSRIPLGLVVFFAVLNEIIDWVQGRPQTTFEPLIDIINTIFWPLMLYILARRRR